ncbi:MAG: hydantoinase/oxoprolinase family protein [Paracoccaceae bacterium]|nr:hydantoinase/oxoprolinase family protein [Paracoccaceae bacterium]
MSARIGVDIGGTFTDVALENENGLFTTKVLTDYQAPEAAILKGIAAVCDEGDVAFDQISQIIHGTTLVTNALIERRGAKTAFITTEGFRDVIEMRSENRFEQYDLNLVLPDPLVAREHRLVAHERVAATGEVLLELSEDEVARLVQTVQDGDYEAAAIGFMHAYANPTHERRMAAALGVAMPGLSISLSSVVSPQMRELPRFNTVIANAYVQPQVADYLRRLMARLTETGIDAPVFMLHSGGGLMSVETAIEQPVRLLESGPAGGAIFAAGYARSHGIEKALSFDMGGTTAKICMIENGAPKSANTFEIARTYRFKKGSGMTVSTPVVEMVEIGAGGGSIASVDSMGRIQVGPKSAGSEPGPACYQRGGKAPTVTDANLILGRLDPDAFAGGKIRLNPGLAKEATERDLSSVLNVSTTEAAFGVTEMVDENMANAARVHTVEHGRDIEHFTMIAFGGGAPLHASRLCEKLGIEKLIIPPGAGVGSAIGFLRAPFSFEATRGFYQRLDAFDADAVNAMMEELDEEASSFVAMGAGERPLERSLTVFMRYAGQGWEIPVAVGTSRFAAGDDSVLLANFEEAYRALFGRTIDGLAVEITNWAFNVSTRIEEVTAVTPPGSLHSAEATVVRQAFDAGLRRELEAKEVRRADMTPGTRVEGPAVVTEEETSTIVTACFHVTMQKDGALLIARKEAAR